MDVYITEKKGGTRVALSMLPEKTKRKASTKFRSYDIIQRGEIKVPGGTKLQSFSWSGTFPGASRKGASFVKRQHWKPPKELESIFDRWRKNGTELVLMVTETSINSEVYISDFTATNTGGAGDVEYSVTFIESKSLAVYTTEELDIKPAAKSNENSSSVRPEPAAAAAKTYTVVAGDCLWNIAQKFLGAGAKYESIYAANKSVIDGKNKGTGNPRYTIYVGQVLTIPS